jgi:hypothetical protein
MAVAAATGPDKVPPEALLALDGCVDRLLDVAVTLVACVLTSGGSIAPPAASLLLSLVNPPPTYDEDDADMDWDVEEDTLLSFCCR